jgi:gamma-glutamyl:cysteine ligase YbdK (ATP-grasp superfamily)
MVIGVPHLMEYWFRLPFWLEKKYYNFRRIFFPHNSLDVLGPEHEFSIVDKDLNIKPISDKIIKDYYGKLIDFIKLPRFSFGKEASKHVLELRANFPFSAPERFEETMQSALSTVLSFINEKYNAHLLGTGMHPLLKLEETSVWSYGNQEMNKEFNSLFNLYQHGWLNIQSFQLNLPAFREFEAVRMYNELLQLSAYLPAIASSSPIFEGQFGPFIDNRLHFFKLKFQSIPSIVGDIIPESVGSFSQYKKEVIGKYSLDLAKKGASDGLLYKDWMNGQGLIFRFGRSALELRVLDEQECIKSDVALSCFIRAVLRGLLSKEFKPLPHSHLVSDFNSIIKKGLDADVIHPQGKTAKEVCQYFFNLAYEYATKSEKKYLWIIKKRIEKGSLSELIKQRVIVKSKTTSLKEAIISVYQSLIKSLSRNQPYF